MLRSHAVAIAAVTALLGSLQGCTCDGEVDRLRASLVVEPGEAILNGVPVAQDTPISFLVPNRRTVNLDDISAVLSEDSDPAFVLVDNTIDRVLPGQTGELSIKVRPLLEGTITATLIVTTDDDEARPNQVEVPISVTAVDVGLPIIQVTPTEVVFDTVGRNDVSRTDVTIKNIGVRNLLLDSVTLSDDSDPVFRLIGGIRRPASPIDVGGTNQAVSVELVFQAIDTERHTGTLLIESNDPETPLVSVPLTAQAVECPIAVASLVDAPVQIEPFDTVRLDGRASLPGAPGTTIPPPPDGYQWTLLVRPIGSTATLAAENNDRTELEVDLAGLYQVQLEVFAQTDDRPEDPLIRSCEPAIIDIDVKPSDDLHIQLVWDHPSADLDLHVLNDGGEKFTHEGDVYFSNREPLSPDVPGWSENADENPRLDVDDSRGYGPENTNIKHPAPGSRWTILVHYWNKQTGGDPTTTAILRLFVYGRQSIELERTFEDDQQIWEAIEIVWGDDVLEPPAISQLNGFEPFPRPF